MKHLSIAIIFCCWSMVGVMAQSISIDPATPSKINIKATVPNKDSWGNFGTTATNSTSMVFRRDISDVSNWQTTGTITGALGYNEALGYGMYLASYMLDLGLYSINNIQFGTSGAYPMFLNSVGSLGLGTNVPSYKLHANGDGHFSSSPMAYSTLLNILQQQKEINALKKRVDITDSITAKH